MLVLYPMGWTACLEHALQMTANIGTVHVPARVLLVVDQPLLAQTITFALNHGHCLTQVASSADAASSILRDWQPHLAIINMDLAEGSMLTELGYTEQVVDRVPAIALTRRGDLKTTLAAFGHGVDDILTVPFSTEELIARVMVVLRRTYRAGVEFTPVLHLGELEIDILNRSVRISEHELGLTSLEQNLLYLLAANAGRLLTRDEILDHLWGVDFVSESNIVDRHVRNLRIKLQNNYRQPRYIATVPGKGYRFVPTTAGPLASDGS
jgi:DNA-binding response OmpR family regulator